MGLLILIGCGMHPARHALPPSPGRAAGFERGCSMQHGRSSPLIVEWSAAARGALESRLQRGVVVVRYAACELEVLPRCEVPASQYRYGGFTRKTERVRMHDTDEIYANLPVGAAKLEGKLATADALTVSMTTVGMYEAEGGTVAFDQLVGDCDRATHVVSGIHVGAYGFFAERAAEIGIGGGLAAGPQLGGRSRAERETLAQDGDAHRCDGASPDDDQPPPGCGALLRLELDPLGEPRRAEVACPQTMAWNGAQCTSMGVADPRSCPAGFVRTPAGCERDGGMGESSGCPRGMARIPGGSIDDETLTPFCLDLTEVTAWAYARCVEDGTCSVVHSPVWWPDIEPEEVEAATVLCTAHRPDRADHPINCITWEQARTFCRWRGGRLPRDIEWAWAAAGGHDRRTYPWGEALPDSHRTNACGIECRAWFERRGVARPRIAYEGNDGWPTTAVVGSYPEGRSRWGPLDLAGNVAEWTADQADDHHRRRVRGGSLWVQRPAWLSNLDTTAAHPDRRDPVIGFRCATDP